MRQKVGGCTWVEGTSAWNLHDVLRLDLERRAWDMTARRLGMQAMPTTRWPRDFNLADVVAELQVLSDMQAAAMPPPVIAEQQRRGVTAR